MIFPTQGSEHFHKFVSGWTQSREAVGNQCGEKYAAQLVSTRMLTKRNFSLRLKNCIQSFMSFRLQAIQPIRVE